MKKRLFWLSLICLSCLALWTDGETAQSAPDQASSSLQVAEEQPLPDTKDAELVVEVEDSRATKDRPKPLPVRVVVTASDGSHPDGSGHRVYADGRFFAEGRFTVKVPPGETRILLRSGPNYLPLDSKVEARAGKSVRLRARLYRWFAPEERGWYAGDNHVHAQHDAHAIVKTSLAYTALQARANGLSYITEAGSELSYKDMDRLSTETFLFRYAPELRPGPFVGHLNTPGISTPIPKERLEQYVKRPLPVQALVEAVHELGGAVIYTHPLTPPHQLHWMGACEAYSDAVLGRCADAFDIDSRATEHMWFALLNLGNKLPCSSYTDCALGRLQTPSPGDRRVYCHAAEFTYPAIVKALREGRTFATNGGPVFPFFTVDGQEERGRLGRNERARRPRSPGATLKLNEERELTARVEIHSLHPLKTVQLYRNGNVVKAFDVAGKKGETRLTQAIREDGKKRSWFILRAEDEQGHWAITSPVYVEPSEPAIRGPASFLLLEISNHTRFIQLRRDFFAHVIVTVSADDSLKEIELLRDKEVLKSFPPALGNELTSGKIPVTELEGEYAPGWVWHPNADRPVHFQADWAAKESGWYQVRAVTARGRTLTSDEVHFDARHPRSHALSAARLRGPDTEFVLWGYGEEMPLADITLPFKGDHWWYPQATYWRVRTAFDGQTHELKGGLNLEAAKRFRLGGPG